MRDWGENDIPDLTGKRALITGAASGIGYEAARALAEHGAEVIVVDRNEELGRAVAERIRPLRSDAHASFRMLDLGRLESVKDFAAALVAEGRPIDILINNAGIQPISQRRTSADGFELTFAIGHLGHFALTGGLLPLLRAAPAPRVVTVSSMVHGRGHIDWDDLQIERGYRSQRAYNQTKLANLLFAREFQRRIDASNAGISSMAVHPGVAQTSIGANRSQLGKFRMGDHIVSSILSVVMPYLGQPASAGALPTLFAATAPEAEAGGFYGPNGVGEMKGPPAPATIKRPGQDMDAARRLWDVTEQMTGVSFPL
ncbi:NAD(P)-dependent dehydrogenase, short-chain alcohol dehydrogenase family [Sphingomonas laterariae]|uniref:NAD(P)-dependent dehydrogenase, short-chain alcohol dehydrogenase family n=1 Tax=Edaphosphingomonas laterariae TaxID=861865 RepID=A0A239GW80_9SPHN|nr:SDR family oxidoreductase [Sphingomonas laterariae]SNS73115.1 NAD(P)-dependent dehydrogenase, short-chain alcohol dehydrogenase family [Sphingomonas laterariae]